MTALPHFLIHRPRRERSLIERPKSMLETPRDAHAARCSDPLSDVLRAVRLRGAVFFLVDATPPWVSEAPSGDVLAPLIMPGAQHLIEYHVVKRGTCYGGLIGAPPIELCAGDVIVFPRGDAHVMSSAPHMRESRDARHGDIGDLVRLATEPPPFALKVGETGAPQAEVVCGFLGCDARPFNPLITTLPRVLHVKAESSPADPYLSSLIALTLAESSAKRPGGECILARLSELMFVEVVRRHLQTLAPDQDGWLAGLRDPIVGRALSMLHARPAFEWTLESLAESAASSRSALAERFKELVGQPPMQYLAQWRMQIAARLLDERNATVAAVAYEVGYGSEAAFSRAFKKLVGVSPSEWRERSDGSKGVRTR
jgi:AraC-like DNA-binding protein